MVRLVNRVIWVVKLVRLARFVRLVKVVLVVRAVRVIYRGKAVNSYNFQLFWTKFKNFNKKKLRGKAD